MKNEVKETRTEQGGFSLKGLMTAVKRWCIAFLGGLLRVFAREVKIKADERLTVAAQRDDRGQAADELMHLYRAWMAYLLLRLGETEVRVPVSDISRALETFSCSTVRVGDEYVICFESNGEEVEADEPCHADESSD